MTKDDHPPTSDHAAKLLQKAYSLQNTTEAKKLYADWATTYDQTMLEELGYLTPKKASELLNEYDLPKSARILDVGSGTGLAGMELNSLGFGNIDALDYSREMLGVAKSRGVYQQIIEADLNKPLDLADNCYNALICTGTFTHAHVGGDCLPELFRVLKVGGLFACTVHKDIWSSAGFEAMQEKLVDDRVLTSLYHKEGPYYSKSTFSEGWYIVWQKRA